ncbi:MAG: SsrA-binding protein SmpB [Candidatus Dadabacteria bacterium]|nr:MAG: SsrA-binding protein SmpB [Candidatus Dadabacteria bacterium]
MAKKKKKVEESGLKVISTNKKARFNYQILEKFEAGLVLSGAEIKSIRQGGISLDESYVRPDGNELYLVQAYIKPYSHISQQDYDPRRKRKLLMHRHEINKLRGRVEEKGLTLVPLRVYLKRGYAKLEIGLARGKAAPDKRKTIKERELKREAERAIKRR